MLKSRGQDFTSLIWKIEGDGVAWFQRWMWTPLTWYFAWVYVIVFPALMPWAIVVFDYVGETRRNLSLLAAYLLNYLLVLPFYIWFPVRECHVFSSAGREHFTRLALDDLHPAINFLPWRAQLNFPGGDGGPVRVAEPTEGVRLAGRRDVRVRPGLDRVSGHPLAGRRWSGDAARRRRVPGG